MRTKIFLLTALALGSGACAHKSAPADYGYDDYRGDADYEYDESYAADGVAEAEMAPPAPAADEDASGIRFKRAERRSRRDAREVMASPASEAPAEPTAAGAPAVDGNTSADPEPAVSDDTPDDVGRHIVYIAAMSMSVFNLQEAMEAAEALPDKYGGYIASMTESSIVLRIPSKNLRKIMTTIGDLGVVESRSLQAQDVTDEFYDVESRIAALEKTHAQLLDLLGKARNVQEALEVRRSLDEIAMELEVLKGRMRKLQNMISFSTLTLNMVERGPHMPTPTSNDPFHWVDGLGVESTEWK